jgi:hypothetical protein
MFPIAGFPPLVDQRPPWPRAHAAQDNVLADVVHGPLDLGVQDVVVVACGTGVARDVDLR